MAIAHKSRYTCDTIAARFFPVGVNSGFETALCQHGAGFLFIKPSRFYNIDDDFDIADVAAIDKIGFEKFVVDCGAAWLCFGPGPDFLGKPAIVGVAAFIVGKVP
jgi:hypothetical protein